MLENFGKIEKKSAQIEGGGSVFVLTQNFGNQLFSGTCNFFENANFQKKIFSATVWMINSVRNWYGNFLPRNY